MLQRIIDGRTDLVFEYLAEGHPATAHDEQGVSLISYCAYHGDVSAIRYLVTQGESLQSLGENLNLNGAVFHGTPRCERYERRFAADVGELASAASFYPQNALLRQLQNSSR